MLGVFLVFSEEKLETIQKSLELYIYELPSSEAIIYKHVLNKLKNVGNTFDGMYMRCMEQALFFTSKKTMERNGEILELAEEIAQIRLDFQYSQMKRFAPTA